MNSQILTKINNFAKRRLIEFFGILMLVAGAFLFVSIVTYSPGDPNFIYSPENAEIKNIGGFYGSVISDLLLQSLGLISFFLALNFFAWGIKIIAKKKINNFTTKIFFLIIYISCGTTVLNISFNDSFWLIDNGNGGFVGRIIKENIYYFSPLIENNYVVYFIAILTVVFFLLSLSIKLNEFIKLTFLPFQIIKKIFNFLNKSKKNPQKINDEIYTENTEVKSYEENNEKKINQFYLFPEIMKKNIK